MIFRLYVNPHVDYCIDTLTKTTTGLRPTIRPSNKKECILEKIGNNDKEIRHDQIERDSEDLGIIGNIIYFFVQNFKC